MTYTLPPGLEETRYPDGGVWYKYQGRSIKSVGKILDTIYPMREVDPFYLERGKFVHAACCLIDANNLNWEALDSRLKPYCKAYKTFLEMASPIVEASELTVIAPDYSYGGRLDRIYRLPGRTKRLITDIKVGSGKEKRYRLQVAAYLLALAWENYSDYDLAILNLHKNGNPRLSVYSPFELVPEWREILEKQKVAA